MGKRTPGILLIRYISNNNTGRLQIKPSGTILYCRRWDLNPHDIAATGT